MHKIYPIQYFCVIQFPFAKMNALISDGLADNHHSLV